MLAREISPIQHRQYYNSSTPGSPASTSDTLNLPGSIDYQPSEVDMDDMPEPTFDDEPLERKKKARYSFRNKDKC